MPTLIVLDAGAGEVQSVDAATGVVATVASARDVPDGVVVDKERGVVYWTNMGVPEARSPGAG